MKKNDIIVVYEDSVYKLVRIDEDENLEVGIQRLVLGRFMHIEFIF